MGYLYTLLSVLSGTVKGYCGKRTSEFMKNPTDGIFISMLRMIICTLLGGAMVLFGSNSTFQINLHIFFTLSFICRGNFLFCCKLAYVC